MVSYTITLSAAQDKALRHVAADPQFWIQNVTNVRCAEAIDKIVKEEVERKLAANETISGSKEDIVMGANIQSAVEIHEENMNLASLKDNV